MVVPGMVIGIGDCDHDREETEVGRHFKSKELSELETGPSQLPTMAQQHLALAIVLQVPQWPRRDALRCLSRNRAASIGFG